MAYTTINKSTDYFNTKLYTGTGSSQSITGVGHQPDFVWIKDRDNTRDHQLFDAVRGAGKILHSNANNAEGTDTNRLSAFNSDGFSLGSSADVNDNSQKLTSWNWKANGAGSANSAGTITSTVSANTTAGFSIVKYTGNSGGNGYSANIGHGLGVAPSMVIVKCLSHTDGWFIYHKGNTSAPETDFLRLDSTNATTDLIGMWYDTAPTNNVFTVGTDGGVNNVGRDYIAYCFADKTGYSKFGSYTGNVNTDGAFVYTGFKPAWVMIKRTDGASDWVVMDNKRDPDNVLKQTIYASSSNAEVASVDRLDFVSNGFKNRASSSFNNGDGHSYIYMAFAEAPLVGSNNIPCTAR